MEKKQELTQEIIGDFNRLMLQDMRDSTFDEIRDMRQELKTLEGVRIKIIQKRKFFKIIMNVFFITSVISVFYCPIHYFVLNFVFSLFFGYKFLQVKRRMLENTFIVNHLFMHLDIYDRCGR